MTEYSIEQKILQLSQDLLDAIAQGNWERYSQLCASSLSAFEPEAVGTMVEGLSFHKTYFSSPVPPKQRHSTICSPHIRHLGETIVVSYIRLIQILSETGQHISTAFEETRIWHRISGTWIHVHFHRSRSGQHNL